MFLFLKDVDLSLFLSLFSSLQLADAALQRVGPVGHLHPERAFQLAFVEHREVRTLHRTGELAAVAGLNVAGVATQLHITLAKSNHEHTPSFEKW